MEKKGLTLNKQIKKLQQIIFSKCLDCSNHQYQEVFQCPITDCPLWEFRPMNKKGLLTLVKKLSEKKLKNSEAKNY